MKKKEIMNRKKKRLTFQQPEEKSSFKSVMTVAVTVCF